MARKAVQGYTEKSFYDNTRYLGIISTLDPQNEGYFRHMVNFDVSDTGQSVTPRKGFLTTTLEGVSLSDSTIVFFQKDIQKYIVFDPLNREVYLSSLDSSGYFLNVEEVTTNINWAPLFNELLNINADLYSSYTEKYERLMTTNRNTIQYKRVIPNVREGTLFEYLYSAYNTDPQVFMQNFFDGYRDDYDHYYIPGDTTLPCGFDVHGTDNKDHTFTIDWDKNALHIAALESIKDDIIQELFLSHENPKAIVDMYGIHKQVMTGLYDNQQIYLEFYYREPQQTINGVTYPANTLEINLVKTHEHVTYDPTQRNIASAKSIIPSVMQNIYTESNRPEGHVSTLGQFLYIKDADDNYAIQHVYPNKSYDIIPYFDLTPASQLINNPDAAWAFRCDVLSTGRYDNPLEVDVISNGVWCELDTKVPTVSTQAILADVDSYRATTPADQRHYKGLTQIIHVVPKSTVTNSARSLVIQRDPTKEYNFNNTVAFVPTINIDVAKNLQETWMAELNKVVNLASLIECIRKMSSSALFYMTDLQDASLDEATNELDRYKLPFKAKLRVKDNTSESYESLFMTGEELIKVIINKRQFVTSVATGIVGVVFNLLPSSERISVVTRDKSANALLTLSPDHDHTTFRNTTATFFEMSYPMTCIDGESYKVILEYISESTVLAGIDSPTSALVKSSAEYYVQPFSFVATGTSHTFKIGLPANGGQIIIRSLSLVLNEEVENWKTYPRDPAYAVVFASYYAAMNQIPPLSPSYDPGYVTKVAIHPVYNTLHGVVSFSGTSIQVNTNTLRERLPKEFFENGYHLVFYFYPYDKTKVVGKTFFEIMQYTKGWITTPYIMSSLAVFGYDPLTVTYIEKTLTTEPDEIHHPDGFMVYDNSRLVVWKGNSVYMSEPNRYDYFRKENHKIFNERVVKVIQFKEILLVFTVQNLYAIYEMEIQKNIPGNDGKDVVVSERMWLTQAVLYNIMASNKYADVIQVFNQMVLFYSEDGQMFLIKPSTQIDDQTRFSLQYFNKAANDILLNYTDYMNERLANYNITERITKDQVTIKALLSVNTIKIFYCAPGYITYILVYDVLNNRYTVHDSLTFTDVRDIMYTSEGELYLTLQNQKMYMTKSYVEPNEMDNYVDMSYVNDFKRIAISALLDTGNLNLNNHLQKRFRDLQVVFKNLSTSGILFNVETTIDDVVVRPYYTTQLEVQDVDGTKYLVSVPKSNHNDILDLVDISQVSEVATSAFQYAINNNLFEEQNVLMDFEGYTSSKLLTHRTSILGLGKVFRLKLQFLSKGKYKIQSFGIVYKERRL